MRLHFLLLPLALTGCPGGRSGAVDTPTGPIPAVDSQLSIVKAHVLRAKTELETIRTTPAARLACEKLDIALAALPVAVEPAHTKAAANDQPAQLAVTLAEAARIAQQSAEDRSNAVAKAHEREVKEAKKQARLDTLAEVFTWLAGLAGIVSGFCALACAASFAVSFPPLASARRALACVSAVALVLVAVFSGAVMALGYPWIFGVIGVAIVAAIASGAWYLWKTVPS